MSLLDVIDDFATGDYTVTRADVPETLVGGIVQEPTTSTFVITASVQPIRGRELMNLPEAQHSEEIRVLYTATELRPRAPTGRGDLVTIDGEFWRVARSERWQAFGETHWRVYISREANP